MTYRLFLRLIAFYIKTCYNKSCTIRETEANANVVLLKNENKRGEKNGSSKNQIEILYQ